jgi:hypothetical protein
MNNMLNFEKLDYLIGLVIFILGYLLFNRYQDNNMVVSLNDTFLQKHPDLISSATPTSESDIDILFTKL